MKKELLRVGVWNKTVKIPLSRLKEIANKFVNKTSRTDTGYRVPLFIGHPEKQGKEPAVGWLEKVWLEGQSLFGEFADLTEKAIQDIKEKSFRDVSVGIFENRLDHVALTNNPAVSNLGDFFSTNKNSKIITLSQITEEENDMELQEAIAKIATLEAEKKESGIKLSALETENSEVKVSLEEVKTEAKEATEKLTAKEADYNKLIEEGEKSEQARLDKADSDFVDGLVTGKKLAPVNREITISNLKAQRNNKEELTLKDFDGKDVKKSALEAYKESLTNSQELIEEGEVFVDGKKKGTTPISKLEKEIDKYMEENKDVDFNEASRAVLSMNPELDRQEA